MTDDDIALRRAIVETAQRLNATGLNQGTAGNVSARSRTGFLITPSGVAFETLAAEDIVAMGPDGKPDGTPDGKLAGRLSPSSEWRFHRDILAERPDVGAVVHVHSPHATSLACHRRGIPPFHYMIAVAGGRDIRCAGYATFGTQALADAVLVALEGRKACLMANHGMIATGRTPAAALALAIEVEALAGQYWRALQIGDPVLLTDAEMDAVMARFEGYGQPLPAGPRDE